ncbi:MAG TPA: glycosyltransferase N-terminal domain-containing protein, partial [Arenicellales bacterium]|nr:glycosyltransferase N-terminal domain-containing protein [Arenicellales bacterium]
MLRYLYTGLLYLAFPLILVRLLLRGFRNRDYWSRWGERFGRVDVDPGVIWFHAVSVGEVQAAAPLIESLLPAPVLVTTMTPTGSAQARRLFPEGVQHCYAPYDYPGAVRRFLDRARPRCLVILETEIWPNIIHQCHARGIRIGFANLRLSQRSYKRYARFGRFMASVLGKVDHFAVQSEPDARRLVDLGADPAAVQVTGSIKFEVELPASLTEVAQVLRREWGQERPVWIASVGVDPVSRQDLWRMVQELTDDGMAVVWSTAYLDEAERCESVLLLNEGKLEFDGPPQELTDRIKERSFRLTGISDQRRAVLARALDLPSVGDGVIQGDAVRVVLREDGGRGEIDALAAEVGARLEPVQPRFEDAFVDLLGGGPGGTSALAERIEPVELESDIAVSCRDLTKRFGDFTATDSVSFEVRKGEIFGLLGPNGAGKSTTFKMLCGLLKPTEGEAHVVGNDLRHATGKAKGRLGYMAQKFSLYGLLSVRQNLDLFAGVYGLEGRIKRERIGEMIETFDLERYLGTSPDSLPLGYKQRLALACALMHRPPVLFLDEPTSGVDPITRREFWTHINGLARKGVTVM